MDLAQRERIAIGFAIFAHLVLFALLSISWDDPEERIENPPMAVDLVAESAPVSTAPEPATEPPAVRRGEVEADEPEPVVAPTPKAVVRPVPPPPPPKRVEPVRPPRPDPQAQRRPPPPPARDTSERRRPDRPPSTTPTRPAANPARTPPRTPPRDTRPAGDPLSDIVNDVTRAPANGRGTNPPAAQTAAQVRQSIQTSISAEVRTPWNSGRCRLSGVDIERLNTRVVFNLRQDGGLERIVSVTTTGVTESNRPQLALFEECARRAIQTAAPFNLPAEHYDYWRRYELEFEKR